MEKEERKKTRKEKFEEAIKFLFKLSIRLRKEFLFSIRRL